MLGRTKASWREKASGRGTRSLLFGPQHIQVEAETTPCSPREGGRREDALRTERFVSLVLCRARDSTRYCTKGTVVEMFSGEDVNRKLQRGGNAASSEPEEPR